jgi:hypothetical protein
MGTAAIAARLSPKYEQNMAEKADKRIGEQLEQQDAQLDKALDDLVDAEIPKGVSQQEAAEYTTTTAQGIIDELTDVRIKRAARGELDFKKVLETQGLKADWSQDIQMQANKRAADIQDASTNQMKNFEKYTALITDPAKVQEEFNKLKGGK